VLVSSGELASPSLFVLELSA